MRPCPTLEVTPNHRPLQEAAGKDAVMREQQGMDAEALVLGAFHGGQSHMMSVGQLRARTELPSAELRSTLRCLVAKGEISGLNTVIESYVLRPTRVWT
jgi:hypothetical protein